MNRDILLNKTDVIHRCLNRIHEEYAGDEKNLHNYTKQDSIILNLQRCCEACIDLAMHVVAELRTGVPQSSRDAFDLLHNNNIINSDLTDRLKAMVGFRNIAVHDYQAVRLEILKAILDNHLEDFTRFTSSLKQYASNQSR
ncbi:hypothetical protein PA598K_05975 [Paenibacillus sp. 598K]|uniref:type VII toxin-antitoxin system HepT family RNase toxin n=1 Tax=Paenibacillus sp. 598K TaxID=1117987 RepID=UPI000FFA57C2|nr:DUF86 domain-containing protein [Paenibacillus sp. 598K]GBF77423.1 hypothetical protein PA598K_05975 [Paenibacillus sp. 598K]